MPARIRPTPAIPDHEVLRKIGGGAYGEVWLARGVTGALRAVKIVWREDFDDARTFEREFEGILKYEPISRDHPALVNILHVGRSPDGVSFYYYVMELGDDVRTGREINPIEYEPRTLRGDHHQGPSVQWPTDECLDVGLRLAEALQHLHQNGLAHRDVKPSNIIFVGGRAKLADIGLVAARGQRTFVGTEGFVPPEGPGSAQADVYSLGKVLYEIATGQDRMNFPELPEEMPAGSDRKRWLELNRIICEICEPRISKRKISTAAALAESLRRIQRGKRRRQSGVSLVMGALLLAGFGGAIAWQSIASSEWYQHLRKLGVLEETQYGMLRVFSSPEGADVINEEGVVIGSTPTPTISVRVGDTVSYVLRKEGYKPLRVEGVADASAVSEPMTLFGEMQVFSPPREGEPWVDHQDIVYQPDGSRHVSSGFVAKSLWESAGKSTKLAKEPAEFIQSSENGKAVEIVLCKPPAAEMFCGWLRKNGIAAGYLTEDHEVRPVFDASFTNPAMSETAVRDGLRPFRLEVHRIKYGRLYVTSEPNGAELYLNGQFVGTTHGELVVPQIKPGALQLLLVLEGYKSLTKKYVIGEGQTLEANLTLQKNKGVVFGRSWENGIGMKWLPLGQDLMVSIWETRVSDYEQFTKESGHPRPRPPGFVQGANHPVVNVSRDDAEAFCKWLTQRERTNERISQNHVYRLPTDLEWSRIAGLPDEDVDASPGWRDARKQRIYPWGLAWPPKQAVGNFADMSAALSRGVNVTRTIAGYDDGHPYTAPVGSYAPTDQGFYDVSGNVQEWVSDAYSKTEANVLGVLRGGGWNTYQPENLYSGSRNAVPPAFSDVFYGFRVVLAKLPPASD